jgi:hypothetical protein
MYIRQTPTVSFDLHYGVRVRGTPEYILDVELPRYAIQVLIVQPEAEWTCQDLKSAKYHMHTICILLSTLRSHSEFVYVTVHFAIYI